MRSGSVNNIYVIPAPRKLSFGTVTILAAGCCVYGGILLLCNAKYIPGLFLKRVKMLLFGIIVIPIMIIGEINLDTRQLKYQTEPMTSIGK